jgi:protein TonB
MKKFLVITICLFTSVSLKAQVTDTVKVDTQKFVRVEQQPEVVGGESKLFRYLQRNLKYPKIAKENNTQGTVRVKFVIERDGSLSDIKVERSLSPETDAEAIRLMTDPKAPKWIPGMVNGKPTRVQYSIPIYFRLDNE